MAVRGTRINIEYLVGYVDEGTRPMLEADRKIRTSVAQTTKVFADQTKVSADAAAEQSRLAKTTAQSAVAQGDLGKAAQRAAVSETEMASATAEVAAASAKAATAAAKAATAYARQAATSTQAARGTGELAAAETKAARAGGATAAASRRTAAAHDEASAAAARSATRLNSAGVAMAAHGKRAKDTGHALSGMLVPMALVSAGSIKLGMDFEKSMEMVHTQAGATQREVEKLRQPVLDLAKTLPQSPQQLSQGLFHLESVGLRGAKAMDALKIAAEGAAVGNTDLESTSTALGSAWLVNIKGAGDLHHVMAELNATVGAGNVRMGDLVEALGTGILPASKEAGLSLHDVMGALAVFTDEGYQASSAAAQFSTALHFLYNPTAKAGEALHSMHMKSTALAVDMHKPQGLLVALRDLHSHLERLPGGASGIQAEQTLGKILPGGRGRIMLTLLNQLDRYQMKLGQIQTTSSHFGDALAKTQDTAAFRMHRAWSTIQVSAIKLGDALVPAIVPPLTKIADVIGDVIHAFGQLPPDVRAVTIAVVLLGATLGPLLRIYGNLATAGGAVIRMLGAMRVALFGVAAAQRATAVAGAIPGGAGGLRAGATAAEGGLVSRLGANGGLVGSYLGATGARTSLAKGLVARELGSTTGMLAGFGGAALRAIGPLAIGAAVVSGIASGIQSKRTDISGKLQDVLHGATFGIVPGAAKSLEQKVAKEYGGAIDAGLRDAANHAQRGYGERTLAKTLEQPRSAVTRPGGLFRAPDIDTTTFTRTAATLHALVAQRAALARDLNISIAKANDPKNFAEPGRIVATAGQRGTLSMLYDRIKAARANIAPLLKDAPALFAAFSRTENLQGLQQLQDVLKLTGDRSKQTRDLLHQLPAAIKAADNSVGRFAVRNLSRGADRSLGEVQKDIKRATADMSAHGVRPGTAQFALEQQRLVNAATSNIKKLVRDGVLTADQGARAIKRISRDASLAAGQAMNQGTKLATRGLNDMVAKWGDGFAKAGKVTDARVRQIGDTLDKMPAKARFAAAQSMVIMAQQLEDKGKLPRGTAARIVKLLGDRFDDLRKAGLAPSSSMRALAKLLDELRPPAQRFSDAVHGVTSKLASMIPKSVFSDIATLITQLGGLGSAVTTVTGSPSLGGLADLAAQGIHALTHPGKKRTGGLVFGAGGTVPILAAGGEVLEYGGRGMSIPGDPTRDGTLMFAPAGANVLTFDGQARIAAGESIASAVANQLPHFRGGGTVSGPASYFGPPGERAGGTAYGFSSSDAGIAVNPHGGSHWNDSAAKWWAKKWATVQLAGHHARLQVIDKGPSASGAHGFRKVDITGAGARKMGINPAQFPTDATATVSISGGAGGGGGTTSVKGRTPTVAPLGPTDARRALPKLVLPSVTDAFGRGYQLGQEDIHKLADGDILPDVISAAKIGFKTVTSSSKLKGNEDPGVSGYNEAQKRYLRMVSKASAIDRRHFPYVLGGGHNKSFAAPYDCSGAVSAVLHSAGYLSSPLVSGDLAHWGARGPGRAVTMFSNPAHTYMRLGSRYFGTSTSNPAGGAGWFPGSVRAGFTQTHPRGMRRGGTIPRFRIGGTVGSYGTATSGGAGSYDARVSVSSAHQATALIRRIESAANAANARVKASLESLAAVLDRVHKVSVAQLERMHHSIAHEIRRLAGDGITAREAVQIKRLRATMSAVDAQIGRRVGLTVTALATAREQLDRDRTQFEQSIRTRGIDAASAQSEYALEQLLDTRKRALEGQVTVIREQIAIAKRRHDKSVVKDLRSQLQGIQDDIAETATQMAEAARAAVLKQAQDVVDSAQFTTDVVQAGFQHLDLQQQIAGTHDTTAAAQARSDYITQTIIPALQRQQSAALADYQTIAREQGKDSPEARAALLEYLSKGNEIAQEQLDAEQQTKDATQKIADQLASFGGTTGFDAFSQEYTDANVGA